jgi:hypothetical protein
MSEFTLQLRLLQQRVPQYESGQDVSENQLIAAMRFVTALEHLRLQQPLLTYSTELAPGSELQQQQAHKQVRAIELMIKGLIQQAWPDQVRLNNHLKTLFNADRVRRWLKLGEINDVLSGMMFSELAQMLVDKKEFSRYYASLFSDPSMLTLLVEPRKTLQTFLDDIRQIRNSITVQKTLSSAQIQLLDNYYAQIARPVQRAFEEGERASIRPDSWRWMPANCIPSGKRRRKWIGSPVAICLKSVTPLKSRPSARRAPRTTRAAHFRCVMGAVGVMVIAIVAGASGW